ncbi:MAG: GNAT family N-acetyltransferase [Acidimicrobiales bacterium]
MDAPPAPPSLADLDAAALVAMPTAEAIDLDGWWLRADPALPFRRANSAVVAGPSSSGRPAGVQLLAVERYYAERGRTPRLLLGPGSPTAVDDAAAQAGWAVEAPVQVLVRPVARRDPRPAPPAAGVDLLAPAAVVADGALVGALVGLDPSGAHDGRVGAYLALADEVGGVVAVARRDGRATGVAFGLHPTSSPSLVALMGMHTAAAHRRAGVATALLEAVDGWAAAVGATHLWLQVQEDNAAARAVYAAAGFASSHRTWYRRHPTG